MFTTAEIRIKMFPTKIETNPSPSSHTPILLTWKEKNETLVNFGQIGQTHFTPRKVLRNRVFNSF